MVFTTQQRVQQITRHDVIIRADGTVEDYGVVGYWHRNPARRFWFWLRKKLGVRVNV